MHYISKTSKYRNTVYIEVYLLMPKFISNFPVHFYFFSSGQSITYFFSHLLLVSKLYEMSFWFCIFPKAYLALICIWDLLELLFIESSIHTVFIYYSDFHLVRKLYISAQQIIPLISDNLRLIGCVENGDFY